MQCASDHAKEIQSAIEKMEPERLKFGGPRELCGAADLISQFKLVQHHEFFCKKSLPVSLSDSHYLHNVVGDTEIRKGEGMQLDQLIESISQSRETNIRIQPFDIDELQESFQLNDMTPVELPPAEKGAPTIPSKSKSESKDRDRKHKKHKDRDKDKDREHKKHKHKHKDRSKDKDKDKDRDRKKDKNGHHDSGDHSKKHHDKKRKHDGDEDLNDVQRHKKNKHKSSKLDEVGAIRVAG
nr:At5g12230 [Arabidopsis thaliana]AAS47657.1 At5g12230 [Arabidopsis thaliana]